MAHGPARARPGAPIDSNSVHRYAITGAYADTRDSNLRRGQVARLVPSN